MADTTPASQPPPARPPNPWPRAVVWMIVLGVVGINAALFIRTCQKLPGEAIEKTGKVVEKAGKALADVAAAFRRGTVTTEFISYATTITNQHYFQFATLKQTEVFTRSEQASTGFGYIPLPEIVVEARAPIEYTYYLDLNGKWNLALKDNVVYVFAPPIRFNKPAVDASRITYEVKKGYFKTDQPMENLKRSVTSLATLKAKENVELVRENGRRQTTEFVERWLLNSFADGKQYPVKVFFADEKPPDGILSEATPLR